MHNIKMKTDGCGCPWVPRKTIPLNPCEKVYNSYLQCQLKTLHILFLCLIYTRMRSRNMHNCRWISAQRRKVVHGTSLYFTRWSGSMKWCHLHFLCRNATYNEVKGLKRCLIVKLTCDSILNAGSKDIKTAENVYFENNWFPIHLKNHFVDKEHPRRKFRKYPVIRRSGPTISSERFYGTDTPETNCMDDEKNKRGRAPAPELK